MAADVITSCRAVQNSATNLPNNVDTQSSGEAWTTPENAKVSVGTSAVCTTMVSGTNTDWLRFTGFNFDIPEQSNVRGITFTVFKSGEGGITDNAARLVKDGVIQETPDNAIAGAWPVEGSVSYGSNSDQWSNVANVVDVNKEDFGFALSALNSAGASGAPAYVNFVQCQVHYEFDQTRSSQGTVYAMQTGKYQVLEDPQDTTLPAPSGFKVDMDNKFDDTTYYTS